MELSQTAYAVGVAAGCSCFSVRSRSTRPNTLSLLCSHVIWYFYSNLCCCLRHSAFQFVYGSWSTDCLRCMLLADSWALGESVCPPFYVNNSLQRQFSSELVGGPCLVEEIEFSVGSLVLSQKAFTFKLNTHLLPATKDVYDVTLTRSLNLHSVKHTSLTWFNSELKNHS